jgi:hypothetical protein
MFGFSAVASNDVTYTNAQIPYLGTIATAVSLNIGIRKQAGMNTPVRLGGEIVPISEALANTDTAKRELLANNMISINSYVNILSTDIVDMLDQSTDRVVALDDHIALLVSTYKDTADHIQRLQSQYKELENILKDTTNKVNIDKNAMQSAYQGMDYAKIDTLVDTYISAKEEEIHARTYMVFLGKFIESYSTLQSSNKELIQTLKANREPLIKRTTVALPDTSTSLLKKLNLIK